MVKFKTAFYGLVAGLSLFGSAAVAQIPAPVVQTLPNGANAINEEYGKWAVSCGLQDGKKMCFVSQQRFNTNGQAVMSINMQNVANGSMTAVVVLPFGILVSKPVVFQIDETKNRINANIRTCLPQGCMASFNLDKAMISALQTAKALHVTPRSAGQEEEEIKNLTFEMNGFSAALERLKALDK